MESKCALWWKLISHPPLLLLPVFSNAGGISWEQQRYMDSSLQLWITHVHSGCHSAHTVITSPPLHTTPVHVERGWVDHFLCQNEGGVFLAVVTKTGFFFSVKWVMKKQHNKPGSSCSSVSLFYSVFRRNWVEKCKKLLNTWFKTLFTGERKSFKIKAYDAFHHTLLDQRSCNVLGR